MIRIEGLDFAYPHADFRLRVSSLHVAPGERVALIGPSGSGKTTLVFLVAGILLPQAGSVQVAGTEVTGLDDRRRRGFRVARIGFVFQEFELLDYLSVRDNILLPLRLNKGLPLTREAEDGAAHLARAMGLGDKLRRFPRRLSQGERQRVAICRALVTSPELLLADEPTGNLDPRTAESTLDLLLGVAARRGATLLMVTHNHALLDRFDRVVDLGRMGEATAS